MTNLNTDKTSLTSSGVKVKGDVPLAPSGAPAVVAPLLLPMPNAGCKHVCNTFSFAAPVSPEFAQPSLAHAGQPLELEILIVLDDANAWGAAAGGCVAAENSVGGGGLTRLVAGRRGGGGDGGWRKRLARELLCIQELSHSGPQ